MSTHLELTTMCDLTALPLDTPRAPATLTLCPGRAKLSRAAGGLRETPEMRSPSLEKPPAALKKVKIVGLNHKES